MKQDILELFAFVKTNKQKGHTLKFTLKKFAAANGKTYSQVRNLYYQSLDFFKCKPRTAKRYGIDPKEFCYADYDTFTDREVKTLLQYILTNVAKGKSIRKCVFELADGEKNQALRLLNKYRSILRRKENLVYDVMMELFEKGVVFFHPYTQKKVVPKLNLLKALSLSYNAETMDELKKLVRELEILSLYYKPKEAEGN